VLQEALFHLNNLVKFYKHPPQLTIMMNQT